jgi:hypothetical protein
MEMYSIFSSSDENGSVVADDLDNDKSENNFAPGKILTSMTGDIGVDESDTDDDDTPSQEFGAFGASDLTDSSIDDEPGNDMMGSKKHGYFLKDLGSGGFVRSGDKESQRNIMDVGGNDFKRPAGSAMCDSKDKARAIKHPDRKKNNLFKTKRMEMYSIYASSDEDGSVVADDLDNDESENNFAPGKILTSMTGDTGADESDTNDDDTPSQEFGASGASDLTDSSIDDEPGNDMTGSKKHGYFLKDLGSGVFAKSGDKESQRNIMDVGGNGLKRLAGSAMFSSSMTGDTGVDESETDHHETSSQEYEFGASGAFDLTTDHVKTSSQLCEFGVSGASDLTDSSIDDERGNDMTGSGKKWVFL